MIGTLGLTVQYSLSSNRYSIREGRDKLGISRDKFVYNQHGVAFLLDFPMTLDYFAVGAR